MITVQVNYKHVLITPWTPLFTLLLSTMPTSELNEVVHTSLKPDKK